MQDWSKTCAACGARNRANAAFCRECGQALDGDAAAQGSTVRWSGEIQPATELRRMLPLRDLFAARPMLLVGRAPECDVYLPHPSVSRHHAMMSGNAANVRLEDLASLNGVSVNGRRIEGSVDVAENERIGIGPFLLRIAGGELHILDNSLSLRLEAQAVEKVVRLPDGRERKLLDNINLVIEPGE